MAGNALMGGIMAQSADQRGLAIPPSGAFDPRALGGLALTAICSDHQTRSDDLLSIKHHLGVGIGYGHVRQGHTSAVVDLRCALHTLLQQGPQMAVFNHMPHGAFFYFMVVEMQKIGGGI